MTRTRSGFNHFVAGRLIEVINFDGDPRVAAGIAESVDSLEGFRHRVVVGLAYCAGAFAEEYANPRTNLQSLRSSRDALARAILPMRGVLGRHRAVDVDLNELVFDADSARSEPYAQHTRHPDFTETTGTGRIHIIPGGGALDATALWLPGGREGVKPGDAFLHTGKAPLQGAWQQIR